jgi:PHD/YefM family antitoxin component YafN of YafNO toxin-antitoxin module
MTKTAVIEASIARSNFSRLGAQAKQTPVQVTRHGKVEFVIISPDMYETIKATGAAPASELERMQASFKQMFQDMQSEQANAAFDALEAISAEELPGAVAKTRKRLIKPTAKRPRLRVVR